MPPKKSKDEKDKKPYCGINKLPSTRRYGTPLECLKQNKIFNAGIIQLNEKEIKELNEYLINSATEKKRVKQHNEIQQLTKKLDNKDLDKKEHQKISRRISTIKKQMEEPVKVNLLKI